MLRNSFPKLALRAAIARYGATLLFVNGAKPPVGIGRGEYEARVAPKTLPKSLCD